MLSESLKSNTSLKVLWLHGDMIRTRNELNNRVLLNIWMRVGNEIGSEGTRMLSESLKTNVSLTALILESDKIENEL